MFDISFHFLSYRTKSESPSSSLSSAPPVSVAAQATSSQQMISNQLQQTSTTSYGFQLREDQGKKVLVDLSMCKIVRKILTK